ncbi:hydrogenase maturation factor [Burkholderia arboris]|uniref:Hydrogenase maturation factor n=1 Tax=Burkholderia arboris TaxID=488730 RepID=A0A9Q9SGM6_9BURK|nr:hydrogenase maturation factor [Burkholderia arboris]VWB35608.1 hydrogenase maturation factor [Burkholderia arboris]
MTSAYTYRGYAIDVRCEHKIDASTDEISRGFVAIVHIRSANVPSLLLAPIRLAGDHGKLFSDCLDALHAGRAAGEIIVDDLLVDASVNTHRGR